MLPLANRSEVLRRHEAVELLVHLESASEIIRIRSQLAELGGVPQICYKLNMGVGSASTWSWLLKVGADRLHDDTRSALTPLKRRFQTTTIWSADLQCDHEHSC